MNLALSKSSTKQANSGKKQSTSAAAFSPYKPFKEQVHALVVKDGRGAVMASWLALRGALRATVGVKAPKWPGMNDTALGLRIHEKNVCWSHVSDVWDVGTCVAIDAADPHYTLVRNAAASFRAAVTGKGGIGYDPTKGWQGMATEKAVKKVLLALTVSA